MIGVRFAATIVQYIERDVMLERNSVTNESALRTYLRKRMYYTHIRR